MTKSKWDPVPKEYIPSTIVPTKTGVSLFGPVILTLGLIISGVITFLGGVMVGRGM